MGHLLILFRQSDQMVHMNFTDKECISLSIYIYHLGIVQSMNEISCYLGHDQPLGGLGGQYAEETKRLVRTRYKNFANRSHKCGSIRRKSSDVWSLNVSLAKFLS